MRFNDRQLRAVSHNEGPMLVLAGPGSGKTTVIINRISELITGKHVPADCILAVTFSRASAAEMAERFRKLRSSDDSRSPCFGTIHSIFLNILRNSGQYGKLQLAGDREKNSFIRSELEKLNIYSDDQAGLARELLLALSRIKSGSAIPSTSLSADSFRTIMNDYASYMKSEGLIDFDDILIMCRNLLKNDTTLLNDLRKKYRYILVDEFQDVSPIQYETISLLEGDKRNTFVVGDDDQSIYGFRGAAPAVIKRFLNDHPDAETVMLDINYRSVSAIGNLSSMVISENRERIPKKMITARITTDNSGVILKGFDSRYSEYVYIISQLKKIIASGGQSTAVLFRNNEDAALLVRMMEDGGIPFTISGDVRELNDHFVVRDILAYMSAANDIRICNTPSVKSLLRIINRPVRYISRDSLEAAHSFDHAKEADPFRNMLRFYSENHRMSARVIRLRDQLNALSHLSPYAQIKYIRGVIGYDKWLEEFASEKGADAEKFINILDVFEEYMSGFSSNEELINSMSKEPVRRNSSTADDLVAVKIMTMHSSKGLEFNNVFIPDANDSILPNRRSIQEGSIEEERRLFYVAVTRAADHLYITWSRKLHNKKAVRTRFLDCLSDDHSSYPDQTS